MANTFPASGNVGIGTTTPSDLLTVDTGTGNTVLAKERIKGRSPVVIFGAPTAEGYCGGESFVGLVTLANDYATGSNPGDSFFIHDSNDQRMFIGRSAGNIPVMVVNNSTANVAVGLGTATPAGRFVAAVPYQGGTATVQLHGDSTTPGLRSMVLGYGGAYNTIGLGNEIGFVQVDKPGAGYFPLHLQPAGGAVYIGRISGEAAPPDLDSNGTNQTPFRFRIIQIVNNVANTGAQPANKNQIMATFDMESYIPRGPDNDVGCGRFTIKQKGMSSQQGGASWVRALEAQAARFPGAENNRTWGLEVGVHNAQEGGLKHTSVGIYMSSGIRKFLDGAVAQRCNTGILIDGRSGPNETGNGWDRFLLFRKGDINSNTELFEVDNTGSIIMQGGVIAVGGGSFDGDIYGGNNLTITNNAEIYGYTLSSQFITSSSSDLKENIVPVDNQEAIGLLAGLTPVKYNLKNKPERQLRGFVLENVPPAFAVDGKGVDVMAVVATLTGVVRSQREALERLQARVDQLESGGAVP